MVVRPLLALLLLSACTRKESGPTPPGPLGPAEAVVAADMNGDGRDELVVIQDGRAAWRHHNLPLEGKVQVVARGDIGQDGHEEALIATGAGKGFPAASAQLLALRTDGAEVLWKRNHGRNRIADVRVVGGEVFLTFFSGGKTVVGAWLRDGALKRVTQTQMGMQQVPLGTGAYAVGRLYGDAPRSDGDLRIVRPGEDDQVLPTLRGIRSLAIGDVDQDGAVDLLAADGWHYKYGTHARARLVLYKGPAFKDRRILADLPEDYTLNHIEMVPHSPGTAPRILVTGTQGVYLIHFDSLGWQTRHLASSTEADRAVCWSEGIHRYAVISGPTGRVISLND